MFRGETGWLFRAEGLDGIDAGGAYSGEQAGECAGDEQDGCGNHRDADVERANAEEQSADGARGKRGETDAGDGAEEHGCDAIFEDKAIDLRRLRTERDADAELARALQCGVRDNAVDAERGEDERAGSEGEQQMKLEVARGE